MRKAWNEEMLGDVLEKTETIDPRRFPQAEFDYIDVSSVSNETLTIRTTQRLKGKKAPSRARRVVAANDVFFATIRPTLRRIAIVPDELDNQVCSTGYVVLRAQPRIEPRFIFYFLQTDGFIAQMEKLQKGANYPAVTDRDVRSQRIPVPTLTEQQRIVAVLDEAFAGLATGQANAERNVQNARALLDSHVQSVFSQRGKGWVERKLGEICAITSKLIDPREKQFLDLLHVGAGNIEARTGRLFDLRTAREEGLISGKFLFDGTMVLYSKIRPYLMKVARPDFVGLRSADIYPLAPVENVVSRDFLFYVLLSKGFTEYAVQGSARAGMPKVNRDHLFEHNVWLPDLRTQTVLAARLDALASETQLLENVYRRKQAALAALRRSLLHEALSGQL